SLRAELGLAKAYLQMGDTAAAQKAVSAGQRLPDIYPYDELPLQLQAGEVAEARGDQAGAMAAYGGVFYALDSYTENGPGTNALRSYQAYHRLALPYDVVPQLPRADISADMDGRLAELAAWYQQQGRTADSCAVLERVYQEAPQSVSGARYLQQC